MTLVAKKYRGRGSREGSLEKSHLIQILSRASHAICVKLGGGGGERLCLL
jgi:hypothetical protein